MTEELRRVDLTTSIEIARLAVRWFPPLVRRLTAEFTGTAFLVAGVVGSGIMAERLTDDPGLRLLQNAAATAGVLVALILALGSASGAHFNPAVATRCWDQLALRVRR